MTSEIAILAGTAASIGLIHTILGPDHYLPFIVLAKARQWSSAKTAVITLLCGIGHVLSSVVLGFIGIALGMAVFKLEAIETFRGDIAAWMLIAFGFAYQDAYCFRVCLFHLGTAESSPSTHPRARPRS
jgi:sulfite exporter TauE/SafE